MERVGFQLPQEVKQYYQEIANAKFRSLASVLREVLVDCANVTDIGVYKSGVSILSDQELEARNAEMEKMRAEGMTLAAIGEHFGISRERVRQIIGNTGYLVQEMERERRKHLPPHPELTDVEYAEQEGLSLYITQKIRRGTFRRVDGNGSMRVGQDWEIWVSEKLSGMGFENELMPLGHPFDIMVNGNISVDVKSSNQRSDLIDGQRACSPQYHFKLSSRDADYYVFVIMETKDTFVVPLESLPSKATSVRITWPVKRPKMAKYAKYHERWDLLKGE